MIYCWRFEYSYWSNPRNQMIFSDTEVICQTKVPAFLVLPGVAYQIKSTISFVLEKSLFCYYDLTLGKWYLFGWMNFITVSVGQPVLKPQYALWLQVAPQTIVSHSWTPAPLSVLLWLRYVRRAKRRNIQDEQSYIGGFSFLSLSYYSTKNGPSSKIELLLTVVPHAIRSDCCPLVQ